MIDAIEETAFQTHILLPYFVFDFVRDWEDERILLGGD